MGRPQSGMRELRNKAMNQMERARRGPDDGRRR
jgi:hypothetical protein